MADKLIDIFEQARKAYPGKKRGLETEWADFRKRIKDWAKVIPLLLPAIEKQIEEKKHLQRTRQFWPQWPYFQKWIHQRYWENEVVVSEMKAQKPPCVVCKKPATIEVSGKGFCSAYCRKQLLGW